MFSENIVKLLCFSEPTLVVQRSMYSRFSSTNFKFSSMKNEFRTTLNIFSKKFHPRYESFKASNNVRHNSARILKIWSEQFEYVVADRFRRGLQLISLYKKWWGDFMTNLYFQRLASEITKRRGLYFTACLTTLFQWDEKRIAEAEFLKLKNEIDSAKELQKRSEDPNIVGEISQKYSSADCVCNRCRNLAVNGWELFFTGRTFKVWRKEHVDYPGQSLYVYKVYGIWKDVTANDFFRVQVDTNYRKEWDSNTVQLDIVDSDKKSNSDVIYWEFLFPKVFYNRDYVCNRRYKIDEDKKQIIIINENVQHPKCPEKPPIHRVKEYWSHIVVHSTTGSLDQPGIEFTITYFDNPELPIQGYWTFCYAVFGIPEYIQQQRQAAIDLAKRKVDAEKEQPKLRKEVSQNQPEKRVLVF